MKPLLLSFLLVLPVGSLFAQGQLLFGNTFTGITRAPVYGPDPGNPFEALQGNTDTGIPAGTQTYAGAPLAGTSFTVALFDRPAGDGEFREIHRSAFRTGAAAGFWFPVAVTDTNFPPGTIVEDVVRVWDNQGGTITSWDQALISSAVGESAVFTVGPLGGTDVGTIYEVPKTSDIRSFNIHFTGGAFIRAQPQDVTVPAGTNAQMSVEVASTTVGLPSFQWQRDSADIPGATNSTLVFTNVQYTDAGNYRVLVTVPSITLTSRVARLSVQPMIVDIDHFFIPDWGADAIRLTYDSTPQVPVRIEVRSSLQGTWINMGQFVNATVRGTFFDIGPTNDMRFYRLSLNP